jgi:hypothetical protein
MVVLRIRLAVHGNCGSRNHRFVAAIPCAIPGSQPSGVEGGMAGAYGAINATRTEEKWHWQSIRGTGTYGFIFNLTGQPTSVTRLNLADTQGPTSDPFQYYTDPDTVYHHMIGKLYSQPHN